jgi:hypothetical protein
MNIYDEYIGAPGGEEYSELPNIDNQKTILIHDAAIANNRRRFVGDIPNSTIFAKDVIFDTFIGSGYRYGLGVNSFERVPDCNKDAKKVEPTFEELEINRLQQVMQTLDLENRSEIDYYQLLLSICFKLKNGH